MRGGILAAGALDPFYPAIQDMARGAGPKISNYYNTRAAFLDKLGQQYGADYTTPRLSEGAGENIALAVGSLAMPLKGANLKAQELAKYLVNNPITSAIKKGKFPLQKGWL